MASDLVHLAMSGHGSKESTLDYAAAIGEGCRGKMEWSTVRQGSIWINGLFCEHGCSVNHGDLIAVGLPDPPVGQKINRLEEDSGSQQVLRQGLVCSESFPNCSAFFEGQMDTRFNSEAQTSIQMDKVKRGESVFIGGVKSESGTCMDTRDASSKQKVSSQANWSGYFPTNGVSNECLRQQHLRCYAADISAGGAPQSTCEPDAAAQDLSPQVPRVCIEYNNPNRLISAKEKESTECCSLKSGVGVVEKGDVCNGSENANFFPRKEEQRLGKNLSIQDRLAMPLESNAWATGNPSACEDKAGVSGEGAKRPLITVQDNLSTEPTGEEESVRGSREVNQSVETTVEQGLRGSYIDDTFGTHEDRTKSGCQVEEALLYALPYMSLQDILNMERVSKIFREWIRNDVLLWQQLHVEPPLSTKLTDEALLDVAARSKGQLRCLSLVDCLRITESAVEHVVCSNPKLFKLCLPGCSRVSPEAVLRMVKIHSDNRAPGVAGLKQLRLRNIYGLTKEHLDILLKMLGDEEQPQCATHKPRFYHNGHYSPSCDDQRPIDVEACPKCSSVRLVYDCTRKRCQERWTNTFQECRACILCIVRCEECGKCINDNDFEETFCLDLLCSSCWFRLPKCSECNRPGCGRHADHFIRTPETTFTCSDCCASAGRGSEFHVYAGFDL